MFALGIEVENLFAAQRPPTFLGKKFGNVKPDHK